MFSKEALCSLARQGLSFNAKVIKLSWPQSEGGDIGPPGRSGKRREARSRGCSGGDGADGGRSPARAERAVAGRISDELGRQQPRKLAELAAEEQKRSSDRRRSRAAAVVQPRPPAPITISGQLGGCQLGLGLPQPLLPLLLLLALLLLLLVAQVQAIGHQPKDDDYGLERGYKYVDDNGGFRVVEVDHRGPAEPSSAWRFSLPSSAAAVSVAALVGLQPPGLQHHGRPTESSRWLSSGGQRAARRDQHFEDEATFRLLVRHLEVSHSFFHSFLYLTFFTTYLCKQLFRDAITATYRIQSG
ncbi:hypothetical protein TKK_0007267 [Trichogramma kaykai]